MEEIRNKNIFKLNSDEQKKILQLQLQKSKLISNLCEYLDRNPKHQLISCEKQRLNLEEKLKSEYEHKFNGLQNKPFLSLRKHF